MYKNVLVVLASMVLFVFPVASFSQTDFSLKGKTVSFCGDNSEWAPFHFYERGDDGKRTDEIVGFDIDLLRDILKENGINSHFSLLPWKRCLDYVKKNENFQVVLSATANSERERDYLISSAYYTNTPSYFYVKNKFPTAPLVQKSSDLAEYRLCGRFGYNYANFGLENAKIDQGAKNFSVLRKKVLKNHCDFFLARFETLAAQALTGKDLLSDGKLGYAPLQDVKPEPFVLLISKEYKHAEELKKIIKAGVAERYRLGRLDKMLKQYIPDAFIKLPE